MTDFYSVLSRPMDSIPDRLSDVAVTTLPSHYSAVYCESELKAMRTALDDLSARFGIAPDSAEYQAAAVAVLHIAGAGPIDAQRIARLAAIALGLNPEKAD